MRDLTLNEVQEVNGGITGAGVAAVLMTPVSAPVAVFVIVCALVVVGVAAANAD